jgi:hypothetical protein
MISHREDDGPMATKPWKQGQNQGPSSTAGSWDRDIPPHLRALGDIPSEINPSRIGETRVLVSVQNADLGDFVHRIFGELSAKIAAVGGTFTVSEDELVKYFATAIYSRVMWVNHTMTDGAFRPNDLWALPVPMHMVVSAIGIVETDRGLRYIPEWDKAGTKLLMNREQWEDVTRRLIALEPYGFRLVKALERNEQGVEKVMTLIRLSTDEGDFFYADVPPHALECIVALIGGLSPAQPVTMPTHPALVPGFRLNREWVLRWRHDFAKLSTHREAV